MVFSFGKSCPLAMHPEKTSAKRRNGILKTHVFLLFQTDGNNPGIIDNPYDITYDNEIRGD